VADSEHGQKVEARSGARHRHLRAPTKGDRRRTEILDTAEALLRERSALELTIDLVAETVGVSRSSLYFYFDSKWAVIDALVDRASAEMFDAFVEIPTDDTFGQFVDAVITAAVDGWRGHRVVFLAAVERSSHADESTDRWRGIMHRFVEIIARRIEAEASLDPSLDPTPLGGAERAAEIGCWMVERNLYMLFSRDHEPAAEDVAIQVMSEAMLRLLHPGAAGCRPGSTAR
jgi:TetR/AcrR family transcriptional regulator, ethionamide resistance regulator